MENGGWLNSSKKNYNRVEVQHHLLSCEKVLIAIDGFADERNPAARLELHHREARQWAQFEAIDVALLL